MTTAITRTYTLERKQQCILKHEQQKSESVTDGQLEGLHNDSCKTTHTKEKSSGNVLGYSFLNGRR